MRPALYNSYRFGEVMKFKILAPAALVMLAAIGSASAADLPLPNTPFYYKQPPAPIYNWSGFYVGGNLGGGWNSGGSISDTAGSTFSNTNNGASFLGGGQVGVNYEFGNDVLAPFGPLGVVIGAEATFDAASNNNNTINATNTTLPAGGTNTASATINNRWLTTATGKFGYAWDRVLVYGKGGGAWVGSGNSSVAVNGSPAAFSISSNTNMGWTAGIGVEWAFAGNWSARAEYDYIGLNNQSFTVAPVNAFSGDTINVNRNISIITAGVNYRFVPWW
jgi:outer membrane immunogenic protein